MRAGYVFVVNCWSSSFVDCSESFVDGVHATTDDNDEDDTVVGIVVARWRVGEPWMLLLLLQPSTMPFPSAE